MDILWAPWRMKYIEYASIEKPKECFICEAVQQGVGEEKLTLYVGEHGIVLMNLYPYNTGHLLIAPKRHVGDLSGLNAEELSALMFLLKSSVQVLEETFRPDGFNVGLNLGRVAGAGLEDHVHIHVVPRWNGDTNFMPVIANTKVIPEALKDTYRKIMKHANLFSEKP